ncbi:MAG TPA: hypothetical protein VKB04_08250, partial [Anaerolineales bacterium]|nr:hypothetical protein [Anaerolineales bacterium]
MLSVKNAMRAGLKIGVPTIVIAMLLMTMTTNSFAARPPTPTPSPIPPGNACTSTADCLSKMTLDEKIGQMTQANKNALTTPSDITTYALGSLLSGGG